MKKSDIDHTKERAKRLLECSHGKPSMYINDISKLFEGRLSRACEVKGVSRGYRNILRSLSRNDGMTQYELVREAHISAPSVSVALSKMEQSGLVRREGDKADNRKVRVYLTEKGRDHDNFIKSRCDENDRIMLKGITEDEQETLNSLLRRVLENMLEEEEKN